MSEYRDRQIGELMMAKTYMMISSSWCRLEGTYGNAHLPCGTS